ITFLGPQDIELNPTETFAYVADTSASNVVACGVDPDSGELTSPCFSTGSGVAFSGPTSIVFNTQGTLAYITNSNSTVLVCTANVSTGVLSDCVSTGSGFTSPQGIDLNNGNNYAFVTNYLANPYQLSSCNIPTLSTGLFGTCTLSNQVIDNPFGLVLHPNGSFLYVTQPSTNSIFRCNVSNGTLSSCAVSFTGGVLSSPTGIVLN
ncbi:MAG TPA: hypothetical protein VHM20_06110, partial [Gammaproteobacteria bacterium]|nr:hypothetical protein [Gammaproteobacteria bacterium]